MKRLANSWVLFALLLATLGAWTVLTWVAAPETRRENLVYAGVVVASGAAGLAVFMALLVARLRDVIAGRLRPRFGFPLIGLDVALVHLAFAAVNQQFGILDNRVLPAAVVHDYGSCLYFSVATFTTLGYGDFYPVGPGQALAAIESMTGYLVLGILASSGVAIFAVGRPSQPSSQAGATAHGP